MRRAWTWVGFLLLAALFVSSHSIEPPRRHRDPATRWDRFYARVDLDDARWQPNALLVEVAVELRPGRALDLGMGQGRNALVLAERGWQVTGIDSSRVGLRLALAQAWQRGVELDAVEADVHRYDLGVERWDLIVCSYMDALTVERADDIVRALAPGGVLVAETFVHGEQLAGALGRPDLGLEPGALRDAYAELEVLRYEELEDHADWAPGAVVPIVRLVARKR